ncbi:DUF421 domain-containing protein [Anaeromicrobium sediminis]|uniref:YetF C-terminal domain-containing protein n=1 Tax=Anaeromicrobium sediminis TaxID=1478221 RepID=A0A267MF95_9FIRM|nr:DUF421 domain-containing protein [Anaeromicrobium sediminis]PAB58254.1 hypothetical protein CCE28_16600 [Anaeromicrobium sediminis]
MITILIRTIILYFSVLISFRIMGKSELSELQPFELVITLIISELAVLPMENTDIPILYGIFAIASLVFIQVTISSITLKSETMRQLICGKPSILIEKGAINFKELKKLRLNLNDLIEQCRSKDYPYIEDIYYAILETDGSLSILPKAKKTPICVSDLNLPCPTKGLPITLILDGILNYSNLDLTNISEDELYKKIKKHGIKSFKEVVLCYVTEDGNLFVQTKDSQIINFT